MLFYSIENINIQIAYPCHRYQEYSSPAEMNTAVLKKGKFPLISGRCVSNPNDILPEYSSLG